MTARVVRVGKRAPADLAKHLLMERYGLDEPTAYAILRRLAMNRRLTIGETARQLIDVHGSVRAHGRGASTGGK